jgi:hypothetical protein
VLDTPALIVDLDVLEEPNIARIAGLPRQRRQLAPACEGQQDRRDRARIGRRRHRHHLRQGWRSRGDGGGRWRILIANEIVGASPSRAWSLPSRAEVMSGSTGCPAVPMPWAEQAGVIAVVIEVNIGMIVPA